MRLYYSTPSPYARKVRAFVIETGLEDRVELHHTNPWDSQPELLQGNPLSKVPTLIADDGEGLFDSPLICEYLDSLHDGARLIPADGPARWQALRIQCLADGILDAAVGRIVESRRPENLRSADWDARQKAAVTRSLDMLERDAAALDGPLDIAQLAAGCALGYLDFRFPQEPWRDARPRLAAWYAGFCERPSMRETWPAEMR
ncbi:MAG: glutathione S-transferase family protein [Kiloniellales bacterium]